MSEYGDQKEAKMAMSGRLSLMTGSILLLITAVSSSLTYAINFFLIAAEAANGTEEYTELLANANLSITMTRLIGGCFAAAAVIEIAAGILCLMNCNRLDKASFSKKVTIGLLAAELLMQLFLFLAGVPNLSLLFSSVIIPIYMLWGATRLCKLAKRYPDRVYVFKSKRRKGKWQGRNRSASEDSAPKKSLRERAEITPAQKKSLRERAEINPNLKWDEAPEAEDTETVSEGSLSSGDTEPAAQEAAEAEDTETVSEGSLSSGDTEPAAQETPESGTADSDPEAPALSGDAERL